MFGRVATAACAYLVMGLSAVLALLLFVTFSPLSAINTARA